MKTICEQLERDLMAAKASALATYEAATHEESKPENEYDTRGLEASYLAGAQAKRVTELEELLATFRYLDIKAFNENDPISDTAMVQVELNERQSFVFILPKGGGLMLQVDGRAVQTVTPHSPLGEALVGLRAGDVATIEVAGKVREYEVVSVH